MLADDSPDLPALSVTFTEILGTDKVDVVDLRRELDLRRVHTAATSGPADLRAFLAALRDHAG